MNAKFHNKNLLFYKKDNEESANFLKELNKNDPLKSQFILINQDDPRLTLPLKIKQMGQPLILIANGVNEPIIGKDALYWLLNNGFSGKGNGLEYCALGKEQFGAFLSDDQEPAGSSKFSLIGGRSENIETFNESSKNLKSSEFDQRLTRLKNERSELMQSQRTQKPVTF